MKFSYLYNGQDKKILKDAEDALNRLIDCVHEIIEYDRQAKINPIGIANCITFNKEAAKLEEMLEAEGIRGEKVNCKYGCVPFNELVKGYKGTSCNPAGQTKYLEEQKTELNIMMGLCLGHDMIFNAKSKAPVTPFIVKERKLNHNTLIVLNQNKN
jgi:uncharacterized metal-binding protein